MLNIISRSIVSTHTRGPRKVVANLIAGLSELNYPFVINADLGATKSLWIHDDPEALKKAMELPRDIAIIAGPNIYTLPSEIPDTIDTSRLIWVHPSAWVQTFWDQFATTHLTSVVWPAGIDTHTFSTTTTKKDLILVYNKQRPNEDVEAVCRALEALGEKYRVLTYGHYQESKYQHLLKQSKAIVWIGRSESQGIGLLEALAMDVPALVWDVSRFGDWVGSGHERFSPPQLAFSPVTAAPYFDQRCGLRFIDKSELVTVLADFFQKISFFHPRAYIETEISLAKQAVAFLDIYKTHFQQIDTALRDTTLTNNKSWKNASWSFAFITQLKDAIRQIIR